MGWKSRACSALAQPGPSEGKTIFVTVWTVNKVFSHSVSGCFIYCVQIISVLNAVLFQSQIMSGGEGFSATATSLTTYLAAW